MVICIKVHWIPERVHITTLRQDLLHGSVCQQSAMKREKQCGALGGSFGTWGLFPEVYWNYRAWYVCIVYITSETASHKYTKQKYAYLKIERGANAKQLSSVRGIVEEWGWILCSLPMRVVGFNRMRSGWSCVASWVFASCWTTKTNQRTVVCSFV